MLLVIRQSQHLPQQVVGNLNDPAGDSRQQQRREQRGKHKGNVEP
jgi:hypothetical protein